MRSLYFSRPLLQTLFLWLKFTHTLRSILIPIIIALNITVASASSIQTTIKLTTKKYLATRFLNATFMFANNDGVLDIGAKGIFDLNGTQLKANEKMPIASGTKPITAAAILRLYDQGKLDIQDPISKYLDQKSDVWITKMPDWADDVSIHHLLTHTSGIAEYYMNAPININMSLQDINKSIVSFAASKALAFNPGDQYLYSNTNYIILGMVIEKVSGKRLAQFFNDEFFKPLKMKASYLPSLEESILIQQSNPNRSLYPVRYVAIPTGGKPKLELAKFEYMFVPYADGGVFSNTRDIITWYKALHQGQVLSDKSYKMMITKYLPVPSRSGRKNYTGYGVFISEFTNGDTLIHHSGSKSGISEAGFIPEQNLYFAILGNVSMESREKISNTIDLDKPENQLDIIYFREAVLTAVEGN
ncbi:Penicillin-binding protein [Candidatus Trichorickettsia mobilis]|uniref:Penicillin-binding protein n=1 Tax=Candidatus Trichorickettsia mobilis TaxID=1346319 RepID=A0ABZ0UWE3_9RICK|nr:serine hydrolase domain-containing protein [Candidatus Trichorickettsia mobilis]WPY00937.1 Penicillin-binding protein [Candidatus Trichorickettsia mobilis]